MDSKCVKDTSRAITRIIMLSKENEVNVKLTQMSQSRRRMSTTLLDVFQTSLGRFLDFCVV